MRRSLEIPLRNSNPTQIQGITIQGNATREPRMDFSWFGLTFFFFSFSYMWLLETPYSTSFLF